MAWVWEHSLTSGSERLVLLALADNANDQGFCWPSLETIAKKANISRRYVISIIKKLEKRGDIIVERRRETSKKNKSNVYQVVMYVSLPVVIPSSPIIEGSSDPQFTTVVIPSSPEPSLTIINTKFQQKEIVGILAEVTGIDYHIKSNVGRLAKRGKEILEAGYTPEQVRICFGPHGWWYKNDWRGKKNQRPRPEDITGLIKQAVEESYLVKREGEVVQMILPGGAITEVVKT